MKRTATRGKGRFQKRRTNTAARRTMAIVNRSAETKKFMNSTDYSNLGVASLVTWNLTQIPQGNTLSSRIGDKIFVKSLRLAVNVNNIVPGGTAMNDSANFRIIVFRGKYDYSATSYPTSEVFMSNNGAFPVGTEYTSAALDTKQITVLLDRSIVIANNYSGQIAQAERVYSIPINKSFSLRNDDNFGKYSNLYFGIVQTNWNGLSTKYNFQSILSYTDV